MELVEVISPGPDANTRIVPTNRGVDCTTIPTNTADNTVINKLAVGATYTVGRVPKLINLQYLI